MFCSIVFGCFNDVYSQKRTTNKNKLKIIIMKTTKNLANSALKNEFSSLNQVIKFYKSDGVAVSNFVCILLFGTMTFIKIKNKTFGNWLENKLNGSK